MNECSCFKTAARHCLARSFHLASYLTSEFEWTYVVRIVSFTQYADSAHMVNLLSAKWDHAQLTFAALENKGNTIPTFIPDVHDSHGKGWSV